jgi:hypothetical protein
VIELNLNSFLRLTTACLLALFLTTDAAAQAAYTDGKSAQLKASQIKKLKNLRAPIAAPTYVPTGYRLKDAGGRVELIGKFWSVDYWINYENAKGDRLDITSSNEGLGDVPLFAILNGRNPFFEGEIEVGTQDGVEESKKNLTLGCESGWIENKRVYVPAGARSRRQSYRANSTALSAKEVLKVMESLRYLR